MSSADLPSDATMGDVTAVVTCFVMRSHAGHDEVLLAQRSQRVAPIAARGAVSVATSSWSVTAQEQAYTELSEEAGGARRCGTAHVASR